MLPCKNKGVLKHLQKYSSFFWYYSVTYQKNHKRECCKQEDHQAFLTIFNLLIDHFYNTNLAHKIIINKVIILYQNLLSLNIYIGSDTKRIRNNNARSNSTMAPTKLQQEEKENAHALPNQFLYWVHPIPTAASSKIESPNQVVMTVEQYVGNQGEISDGHVLVV